jgi:hypothetical protein
MSFYCHRFDQKTNEILQGISTMPLKIGGIKKNKGTLFFLCLSKDYLIQDFCDLTSF